MLLHQRANLVLLQKEATIRWETSTECSQQCRPVRILHQRCHVSCCCSLQLNAVGQMARQQPHLVPLSLLQPGLKHCVLSPVSTSQRGAAYCSSSTSFFGPCPDCPSHSKMAPGLQLLRCSEDLGEGRPSVTPQAGLSAAACLMLCSAHCSALRRCFCKYPSNSWSWPAKTSPKAELPHLSAPRFFSPTSVAMAARLEGPQAAALASH